jgi:hypothetical protein
MTTFGKQQDDAHPLFSPMLKLYIQGDSVAALPPPQFYTSIPRGHETPLNERQTLQLALQILLASLPYTPT